MAEERCTAGRRKIRLGRDCILCYVYVNVKPSPPVPSTRLRAPLSDAVARHPALPQAPSAFALDAFDLREDGVDVLFLLQEQRAALGQNQQELGKLRALVARNLIEIEKLSDVRQRQAEAFSPQDQLEPHPLALAVDALAAPPLRREKLAVLVEPDGARRERELACEIGNRVRRSTCRSVGGSNASWHGDRGGGTREESAPALGGESAWHDTIGTGVVWKRRARRV